MKFKTELELKDMSKKEIDAYGDSIGMNLDRRLKKDKLISQVLDYQLENTKVEPQPKAPVEVPTVEVTVIPETDANAVTTKPAFPENETITFLDGIDKRSLLIGGIALLVIVIILILVFA